MRTGEQDDDDVVFTEDVFFHILLCLPVMSLLRFKSVCKSWRALIQCPAFIHQHLQAAVSDEQNYSLILMNPFNPYGLYCAQPGPLTLSLLPSSLTAVAGPNFHKQLTVDLPSFPDDMLYQLQLLACNGILCIHTKNFSLFIPEMTRAYLWNPATNEISVLPPSRYPPSLSNPQPYISLGFGLNLKSNDYKLVRILKFLNILPDVNHVEVYTLSTDSWKTIDAILPVNYIISDSRALYRNGTYCWLGRKPSHPLNFHLSDGPIDANNLILTFDFTNEVFETMSLPDVESVKFDATPLLAIIRDNIACINRVGDNSHLEIWVLNEYGIKESWTRLHKVGPFYGLVQLGLSKTGSFVLFVYNNQLCLHDFATQETKNLPVQGNLFHLRELQVAIYKESLVSVKRGNHAANSLTSVVAELSGEDEGIWQKSSTFKGLVDGTFILPENLIVLHGCEKGICVVAAIYLSRGYSVFL